tara:strand:- start:2831 stop:3976 length:1146 start_codon:yes stop_codon:yes gene_type:complete
MKRANAQRSDYHTRGSPALQAADATLIKTSSLTGFIPLVQSLGGDPEALLRTFNIEPALLENSADVIPLSSQVALLEYSADVLHCEDFALQLAERQDLMILGPLAVIAQNADTVGEALRELSSFMHVYSPGIALQLDTSDALRPQLEIELRLPAVQRVRQSIELSLGVAHRGLQMLYGANFRASAVLMRTSSPLPQSRYQRLFGANSYFGQACNALVLKPEHLERSIDEHNRQLHDTMLDYIHCFSAAKPMDIHSQVLDLIKRLLPTRRCTLPVIAKRMALHERTLQRRLEARGLVFEHLVEGVRRELADLYLGEADMPMTQIAGLLGYAEQSSFNRACRRWHGMAPSKRRLALGCARLAFLRSGLVKSGQASLQWRPPIH